MTQKEDRLDPKQTRVSRQFLLEAENSLREASQGSFLQAQRFAQTPIIFLLFASRVRQARNGVLFVYAFCAMWSCFSAFAVWRDTDLSTLAVIGILVMLPASVLLFFSSFFFVFTKALLIADRGLATRVFGFARDLTVLYYEDLGGAKNDKLIKSMRRSLEKIEKGPEPT